MNAPFVAPLHRVLVQETGEQFTCRPDESVLHGMARLGRKGIPVGCRSGGCGVCRIVVLEGPFEARRMSCDHVTPHDAAEGRVLACCVFPRGDLVIRVLGLRRDPAKVSIATFAILDAAGGRRDDRPVAVASRSRPAFR